MTDFLPGEAELISDIDRLQHTQTLFKVLERRADTLRNELETSPHIDNENVNRDWRFRLGMIHALKWVLSRPEQAREHLNNLENRRT